MTQISVLDVILVELKVGESRDRRPCVVVRSYADGRIEAFGCSSAWSLYDSQFDFPMPEEDPDFHATGLTKSSYVIERKLVSFPRDVKYKRIGCLSGELAERFSAWFGGALTRAGSWHCPFKHGSDDRGLRSSQGSP